MITHNRKSGELEVIHLKFGEIKYIYDFNISIIGTLSPVGTPTLAIYYPSKPTTNCPTQEYYIHRETGVIYIASPTPY